MKLTRSKKLLLVCLGFVVGVAIGNFVIPHGTDPSRELWGGGILFCLMMAMVGRKKFGLVLVIIMVISLGVIRLEVSRPEINESFVAFYNEKYVTFQGVLKEPDVRLDHIKLTVRVNSLVIENQEKQVHGNVLVKAQLYPQYSYGDYLEVSCTLHEPKPIEDFRYDKYLARYNIYSTCYQPRIKLIDSSKGNFVIDKLLKTKEYFSSIINKTIPEPQASFLAGILIGSRKGIPDDLLIGFNRTGVTHIIAISGYNITIISVMIMNLCLAMLIDRKRAFKIIVVGLVFFVIITGATAAVVRSAIMGVIVLLAKYSGRKSRVGGVLGLTACVMLVINPRILMDDAGFQLSFLATLGLIYFVPVIEIYFKWLPKKFALQENVTTTMAAIIFTTPLILFQFGRLSVVAPMVNMLILSVIPASMATGFIQVLLGMVWLPLGKIGGWITWLILTYIIKCVEFFSEFSFAAIDIRINLFWMLFSYILLSVWVYCWQRKQQML